VAGTVSIGTPASVNAGAVFVVNINIGTVTNLSNYQFDLQYNNSVINISSQEGGTAVTSGLIATKVMPCDGWGFIPAGSPGKIRVIGHLPYPGSATGQGYLVRIQFRVVGTAGQSSALTLSNLRLYDPESNPIYFAAQSGSVTVVAQ
jgi:hypothetical protein